MCEIYLFEVINSQQVYKQQSISYEYGQIVNRKPFNQHSMGLIIGFNMYLEIHVQKGLSHRAYI